MTGFTKFKLKQMLIQEGTCLGKQVNTLKKIMATSDIVFSSVKTTVVLPKTYTKLRR